jgi:hypothetical protein
MPRAPWRPSATPTAGSWTALARRAPASPPWRPTCARTARQPRPTSRPPARAATGWTASSPSAERCWTVIANRARARAASAARARDERAAEGSLRRRAAGESSPAPAPAATPSAPATANIPADVAAHLARIAQCESGGDPTRVAGPYRGKYQFDLGTWQSVGGTGDPAAAPEAEQDMRAAMLYAQRGSAPWPVCQYR